MSARLNAPVAGNRGFSFELLQARGRLELRALHHPRYGNVCADWSAPDVRRRIAAGRGQLLARAVGLNRHADLEILDATAGFGRDGFVLASLGARVTLAERQPTVYALLADAHRRALADPATAAAAIRTRVIAADARGLLASRWDVVFLDPMYPGRDKRALASKELQVLRELTGGDTDADALLDPALAHVRRRVVVKRPTAAPPLALREPSFSLKGSQARFDVYLPIA